MNLRSFWNDDHLFWEALLLSLGIHAFVSLKAGAFSLRYQQKHTVEIDITNMGHLGISSAPRSLAPAPNQKIEPAPIPTKAVAPAPEEPPLAPPANTLTGNGAGEYSLGAGDGSAANVLSRIPQLLNLSDLRAILKRYYPEEARRQGRQATVVLDLHIDKEGHVTSVDIARSGGSDFGEAARKAAMLLRFTPAFLGSARVAVKMRQAIQFKLEQ